MQRKCAIREAPAEPGPMGLAEETAAATKFKVTGTMSGAWMSGKVIKGVPGLSHPSDPHMYIFAVHEDGHTKMAAFRISSAGVRPKRVDGRAHVGKLEPIDAASIGRTWDSARTKRTPHTKYKVTDISVTAISDAVPRLLAGEEAA